MFGRRSPVRTICGLAIALLSTAGPLGAQEQDAWTLTVDGTTRTLGNATCDHFTVRDDGFVRIMGNAEDDAGTVLFEFRGGAAVGGAMTQVAEVDIYRVMRMQAMYTHANGVWTREGGQAASGPLFTIDSTRITGSGTLRNSNSGEHHEVAFALDCTVQPMIRGGGSNLLPAETAGSGTLTIDGETRTLQMGRCIVTAMPAGKEWKATGSDAAGSVTFSLLRATSRTSRNTTQTVTLRFDDGRVLSDQLVKSGDQWIDATTGTANPDPLFQSEEHVLTSSGPYTDAATANDHDVELQIECNE